MKLIKFACKKLFTNLGYKLVKDFGEIIQKKNNYYSHKQIQNWIQENFFARDTYIFGLMFAKAINQKKIINQANNIPI